jgi:50S ribosomal protein L16 3-hydroxylase
MACEEGIESRLICGSADNQQWSVEHGPLNKDRFSSLPDIYWTILVQDVDKYLPEAAALIEQFHFLPAWRIDDLMISYAEDQGNVGPHTDSYDVFLIQLLGKRLWKISDKQYSPDDLISDSEIRILKNFEQTDEWLLTPGDMLYLPPHIAHWGIAQGPCMTGSVGFISPGQEQLFNSWADFTAEHLVQNMVYQDADISLSKTPGMIDDVSIERVTKMLKNVIDLRPDMIKKMFGQLVSETKTNLSETILPPDSLLSASEVLESMAESDYICHPCVRMFYSFTNDDQPLLFANGETFELSPENTALVQLLCAQKHYPAGSFNDLIESQPAIELLVSLVNHGYIVADE